MRIGIISDTHGLVRPQAEAALAGVDHVLHAGDICGAHVLAQLRGVGEVTAVGGNNDGVETSDPGAIARLDLAGLRILLVHDLGRPRRLRPEVARALRDGPADVVVFGHSHLPHDEVVGGVRFFNPASAGPRRFSLPVAVGLLERVRGRWRSRHVVLDGREDALARTMNQLSR